MEQLFRETYGRPLEPDVLTELAQRTEGWAASLTLVQAALRERTPAETRSFVRGLSGARDELHDYLAEEVVGELPEVQQQFLMRTADPPAGDAGAGPGRDRPVSDRGPVDGHRGRAPRHARPTRHPPLERAALPPARARVPRGSPHTRGRRGRRGRPPRCSCALGRAARTGEPPLTTTPRASAGRISSASSRRTSRRSWHPAPSRRPPTTSDCSRRRRESAAIEVVLSREATIEGDIESVVVARATRRRNSIRNDVASRTLSTPCSCRATSQRPARWPTPSPCGELVADAGRRRSDGLVIELLS